MADRKGKEFPPDESDEQCLTDVGLERDQTDEPEIERHRGRQSRHIGTSAALGEQPGCDDDERRLGKLRGLEGVAPEAEPAPGAVDLRPRHQHGHHQPQHGEQQRQSQTPRLARRAQRDREHQHETDHGHEQMPLDVIEGGKTLPDGNRGTGCQRQHRAGADQHQDGCQQHAVDGEPPFGQQAAVGAREPHAGAPAFIAIPGRAATRRRNASPRCSKLLN